LRCRTRFDLGARDDVARYCTVCRQKPIVGPLRALSDAECAYLAGIIDGEGHVGLAHHPASSGKDKNHKYEWWVPLVAVSNTDKRLLWWLTERFGGPVLVQKMNPNLAARKQAYVWKVTSQRAAVVLKAALPYLVLKQEQANIVLAFMETHANVGRRGHELATIERRRGLVQQLRDLNRRGVGKSAIGTAFTVAPGELESEEHHV
jgi:hypothetical protein